MDDRLKIILVLVVFFFLIVLFGIKERKRTKLEMKNKLSKAFGQKKKTNTYSDSYKEYFELNSDSLFHIDDTTASDVDLDNVFFNLNHTYSSVGEEYLYYMLRTPDYSEAEKAKKEDIINYFMNVDNRALALNLQENNCLLGKTKKIKILSFLNNLDALSKGNIFPHILIYILYIISIILLIYKTGTGIVFLVVSIIVAISIYFRKRTMLFEILGAVFYISKLEKTAKENIKLINADKNDKPSYLKDIVNEMEQSCKTLDIATRGAGYLFLSSNQNKNIVSMLVDYINMLFHFDIFLFFKIKKGLISKENHIRTIIKTFGQLEALLAIASYRLSLDEYCVPVFDDTNLITDVYHPLMTDPVKNNVDLKSNMLITGSNASGKSTYLKAASLAVIMAETINTVCAKSYNVCHFRPYTSMALKDNLLNGDSFFIAEIKSIKRVIDHINDSNEKIILFIDEILKGTNTVERISASAQITKYLNSNNVKCVFATHDTELAKLLTEIVENVHFKEDIVDGDVKFTYQLQNGPSKSRNAIKLLSKLGYDTTLTENAAWMAEHYEESKEWVMK